MGEWLVALLPERLYERHIARRFMKRSDKAMRTWLKSDRYQQIKACGHSNRQPNPAATAINAPSTAEKCNDCGVGIVTVRHG